eukprot:124768-Prymnesium_polylepis.1
MHQGPQVALGFYRAVSKTRICTAPGRIIGHRPSVLCTGGRRVASDESEGPAQSVAHKASACPELLRT